MIYVEKIRIENGLIVFPRKKIADSIKQMKDGFYLLSFEKFYKQRSSKQNSSNFGIAYKILQSLFSDAFGYKVTKEWVHEFCKERFLPEDYVEQLKLEWSKNKVLVNYDTGQEIDIPFRLTTTKMNTLQNIEYYRNIQDFSKDFFDQEIPDPDPNYKTTNTIT